MKRNLMISLALIVVVIFGYFMQASACTLMDADIFADCISDGSGGYLINYEITAITDPDPATVNYSLTITTISGPLPAITGSFVSNGLPLIGSEPITTCGPYSISGYVELEGGNTITFYTDGTCPCGQFGGCTPGYWRNHLEEWVPTGLAPSDDFDNTFGVDLFDPDITLGEAIWARGGRENRVARHGTAALLSALHPEINYPLTSAEVIAIVQSGDIDTLVDFNEMGVPGFCD